MRIHHVQVSRFRGIREMDWVVKGDFICLVGPGDATKSTVLDAIELALSPRWNPGFDDNDFFKADTTEPIEILVTVGDAPDALKSDGKFGLEARGWSPAEELHDEPTTGDELVLTVRLRVGRNLEPSWDVVNDRNPEGRRISAEDREKLGCVRLGAYVDRQLSWARGSVLGRLTEEGVGLGEILAEAGRAARAAINPGKLPRLDAAAKRVQAAGAKAGVACVSGYRPRLDVEAVSIGAGALALHDGDVPVRMAGLGTRRLLTLAAQREVAPGGGIVLVDEIEHGLEPHRLRRLLQFLRQPDTTGRGPAQVVMTSHSPITVGELTARQIRVVLSSGGSTVIHEVSDALQATIRRTPEAMLSRRVVVCEGMTELGLCRGLDTWWTGEGGTPLALKGVSLADGRGSSASKTALALAGLGFRVALFCDSDRELDPGLATLQAAGVEVIQWAGNMALEERMTADLPWSGIADLVARAVDEWGEEPVHGSVAKLLGRPASDLSGPPGAWKDLDVGEGAVRAAIGKAAKEFRSDKGWFKRVDLAEPLAELLKKHAAALSDTDLGQKIAALRTWAHADG